MVLLLQTSLYVLFSTFFICTSLLTSSQIRRHLCVSIKATKLIIELQTSLIPTSRTSFQFTLFANQVSFGKSEIMPMEKDPLKSHRKKAQRPCDFCKIAKVRCNALEEIPCSNCTRNGVKCIIDERRRWR